MKETSFSNRFIALLVCLCCMGLAANAQVLDWQYTDVFTDIQQSGARPDLYVAANGDMYFSYWNPAVDQLFLATRTKATGLWSIEPVDRNKPGGYSSAIAVDAAGKVHIAYFENSVSVAYLRYATNASGAWVTEDVLPGRSLGRYGPGNVFPIYAQLSVDITLSASGLPTIAFFDGDVRSYSVCTAPPYSVYSDYDLNLNVISRLASGAWDTAVALDVPFAAGNCLADGDRNGEFCHFVPGVGDSLRLITNSFHNHQVVMFSAAPSALDTWTRRVIDSTQRFQPVSNTGVAHQWNEGFEYIDGLAAGDSAMHLAYGLSELYGNGGSVNPRRRTMMYAHIRPDSLGMSGYTPRYVDLNPSPSPASPLLRDGKYRTKLSLAVKGNDLFVSSYNFTDEFVIVQESHNGGLTWAKDTLVELTTNSQLKSTVYGDTVYIFTYDSEKDYLILSRRHITGTTWQHSPATRQENRGASLSSQIVRNGGTDLVRIAYNEALNDQLYYSEGTIGGTWSTQTVDVPGSGADDVSLGISASGVPCIAYSTRNPDRLRFAYRNAGAWTTSTVDNTAIPNDIVMAIRSDSVHICYFDLTFGGLRYARGVVGGSTWVRQVIDSTSSITGRYPDMEIGPGGELHVTYSDVTGNQLKYAQRSAAGVWTIADATPALTYSPAQKSIQLTTDGLPRIAFRDAAGNAVIYAEKDINGLWTNTDVISDVTNLMAIPLRLVLDAADRPWIVYNYSSVVDALRLVRRDDQAVWHAVSVNNNGAEIANSFDFHLVDRDFYLVGKKNAFQNGGIGILYASNGVATDLAPRLTAESLALSLFPNPVQDQLNLEFTLPGRTEIQIELYDLMGKQVVPVLPQQAWDAGTHRMEIATGMLASGLYLCRMTAGGQVFTQKLMISH